LRLRGNRDDFASFHLQNLLLVCGFQPIASFFPSFFSLFSHFSFFHFIIFCTSGASGNFFLCHLRQSALKKTMSLRESGFHKSPGVVETTTVATQV
jgi:hypothetical protein